MIGNGQAPHGWMPKNNVATSLVIKFVTQLAERFDRIDTGTNGQLAHAGISTTSSVIGKGTGSLCFLRLTR